MGVRGVRGVGSAVRSKYECYLLLERPKYLQQLVSLVNSGKSFS